LRQFSFEWNSMLHYDVNTMGKLLFEPASEAHVENKPITEKDHEISVCHEDHK